MSAHRAAIAAVLLMLATPALAQDAAPAPEGTQVCLLRSTETLTSGRKPHVYETELDCGLKPSAGQKRTADLVHNAMDTADALEIVAKDGYKVVGTAWRDSFTGRQILGVITLVKGDCCGMSDAPADGATPAGTDDLPEADEADADQVDDATAPIDVDAD